MNRFQEGDKSIFFRRTFSIAYIIPQFGRENYIIMIMTQSALRHVMYKRKYYLTIPDMGIQSFVKVASIFLLSSLHWNMQKIKCIHNIILKWAVRWFSRKFDIFRQDENIGWAVNFRLGLAFHYGKFLMGDVIINSWCHIWDCSCNTGSYKLLKWYSLTCFIVFIWIFLNRQLSWMWCSCSKFVIYVNTLKEFPKPQFSYQWQGKRTACWCYIFRGYINGYAFSRAPLLSPSHCLWWDETDERGAKQEHR